MGESTAIAWARSSWSPWIGCTEISPGCDHCYARELDKRHRYGGAVHWGAGVPRYRTKQWEKPPAWDKKAAATGERWTVFPSLCDPFDNEVPEEWRLDFFGLIRSTPNLTWLLLTKRVGNVQKMLPPRYLWPNVWIGASIVNQEELDRDGPKLLAVRGVAKIFISYEPALGPVDFTRIPRVDPEHPHPVHYDLADIDQIIVGGESRQGAHEARPFVIGWARDTMRQCRGAGVSFFMKQFGSNAKNREGVRHPFKDRAGADPVEWPEDLRVQEFPT